MKYLSCICVCVVILLLTTSPAFSQHQDGYANTTSFSWDSTSNNGYGPWEVECWANGTAWAEDMDWTGRLCKAEIHARVASRTGTLACNFKRDSSYNYCYKSGPTAHAVWDSMDDPEDDEFRCYSYIYAGIKNPYVEWIDENDTSDWWTF
jgi:hypothetical protein